jgi:acetyl-CoA carboxylase / biotin carboxylase 1
MINRHQSQPVRTGAITSFSNLEALSRGFDAVTSMLLASDPQEFHRQYGSNSQPPNVLNIALWIFDEADNMSDEAWFQKVTAFITEHRMTLGHHGVCRVSILICHCGQYPVYFTLCESNGAWGKEQAIRNVEPALAFQLELSRLSNYNLTPCFVAAKQIHIYHRIARENQLDNHLFVQAVYTEPCPLLNILLLRPIDLSQVFSREGLPHVLHIRAMCRSSQLVEGPAICMHRAIYLQ